MLTRLILLIVIWLSACTSIGTQTPEMESSENQISDATTPVEKDTPMIQPTIEEGHGSVSREVVEKAKADLAKRFGLNAGQIHIVDARAVTWPDASLGCPQPDLAYAQVLTPGYWILLEAEGKQYPYHIDEADQLVLCVRESSNEGTTDDPLPVIPVNPEEIDDGEPWMPVD